MLRKIRDIIVIVVDWFYKPFQKLIPQTVFRYLFTGGMNVLFDLFLYYIIYNYVYWASNLDLGFVVISPHIAAFVTEFPITFIIGFLLAKYITFTTSKLKGYKQLFRYGISVSGSILLNYLLLKLFNEIVFVNVDFISVIGPSFMGETNKEVAALLSKTITMLLVALYSYFMQMYFSFAHRKEENDNETEK
ncbi:MAG: GtrA family protein [Bacteroidales bacterium]|nr:GtrA family protein [Bacteroidales bacterium]